MSGPDIFLATLIVVGFVVVVLLLLRPSAASSNAETLQRLQSLESTLKSDFSKAIGDMAGRVEQIKGDLRVELTERLQVGLNEVRGTVEAQLTSGRTEQSRQLDQFAEKQASGLRESRGELVQGLNQLSAALQTKFDQLANSQAQTAGQARAELAQTLETSTKTLQGRFEGLELKTSTNLEAIRANVETQLASGRTEQTQRLDQFAEKQGSGLRESRAELAQGLNQLSTALQTKFDQLAESQAQAARQARSELAQTLDASTKALQVRFEGLELKTSQNLEAMRAKVDEKLQAISDQVQAKLEKNIQEGFAHFKAVQEHLKAAEEQLRNVGAVGNSINELNSLLKLPHLRGKFGEAELSRLLADFLPAAAFEEQVPIVPGSREAVDAVVKFPKFSLPIDSKFNREAILPLFETNDPAQLAEARAQLATAIKSQAKSIAEKYIHPEHGTTNLALMFLPSETIYFEVIRDGELIAALHKLNVFPVSPNTLVIALRSVEMSLSQYEFAKSVEKTLEQIRQAQASFGYFQKKFEDVGKGLEKAQEAYNTASGHLNRYTNRVVRLTGEPVPELANGVDKPALPGATETAAT